MDKKDIKELKISIHIPFYVKKNKIKKFKILQRVCKSYLKLSKKTNIFVHTNIKTRITNKRIKFLFYKLNNVHPYRLTWFPRKLMKKQINDFDIFIYSEDDVLFSKKNLDYWLKYKDICIKNNFNLGFLRIEKKKRFVCDRSNKKNFLYKKNRKHKFYYY